MRATHQKINGNNDDQFSSAAGLVRAMILCRLWVDLSRWARQQRKHESCEFLMKRRTTLSWIEYLQKSGEFNFYWRKHCLGFDCFIINLERGQRHDTLLVLLMNYYTMLCKTLLSLGLSQSHPHYNSHRLRPFTDSATDSPNFHVHINDWRKPGIGVSICLSINRYID